MKAHSIRFTGAFRRRDCKLYSNIHRPGVAQSVQCLTISWTAGVRSPAEAKDTSSSPCVQTSSEAHPASYPVGTRGPFPGVKHGRGMTLTTHPHLIPRSITSRSYTSSPLGACVAVVGRLYFFVHAPKITTLQ
jgi:hypothetical protein